VSGLRRRRKLLALLLALAATAAALDGLLVASGGSRAPGWSHWWCSPAASQASARHFGSSSGGVLATALSPLKTLLPHWPHLLPLLLALATLVYLWRASSRYHRQDGLVKEGF
jgi:hypothetical protein